MIGTILMFLGAIVALIGSLGLLRFPDVYTRTHAQTVINVGGSCVMILGICIEGFPFLTVKAFLIAIFIIITSPLGSHAITRAAYRSGIMPRKVVEDELRFREKSKRKRI